MNKLIEKLQFIRTKYQREADKPVKLYHVVKSPQGTTFKNHEVSDLKKEEWVLSPSEFKSHMLTSDARLLYKSWSFWCKHWAPILIITVPVMTALYIHFDNKATSEPEHIPEKTIFIHKTSNTKSF